MIKPCKACGRIGHVVHTDTKTGQITKDKCIYCSGKGFIIIKDKKEGNK
jgi:hypothetical protein